MTTQNRTAACAAAAGGTGADAAAAAAADASARGMPHRQAPHPVVRRTTTSTRQRCAAKSASFAPGGTRFTRDSSARPRSSRTRRNRHGAARTLACARRRNDVTDCNCIVAAPYGPLCANVTTSMKRKYITCRNAARELDRATAIGYDKMHKNLVKIGHVVPDRHTTNGHAHRNSPLTYRGGGGVTRRSY